MQQSCFYKIALSLGYKNGCIPSCLKCKTRLISQFCMSGSMNDVILLEQVFMKSQITAILIPVNKYMSSDVTKVILLRFIF